MDEGSLPSFTEHEGHRKVQPIVIPTAPVAYVQEFLRKRSARGKVRVLDVGCGRGDTVAWLLDRGWDAYGIDINEAYLDMGRQYLDAHGHNPGRLRLMYDDFTYPFEAGYFNVILSDQVLEHVPNLDAF